MNNGRCVVTWVCEGSGVVRGEGGGEGGDGPREEVLYEVGKGGEEGGSMGEHGVLLTPSDTVVH